MNYLLIYGLAIVFGAAFSVHLGQANAAGSIRLIAGGLGGGAGASYFSNGPAYAIALSCFDGSFGSVGYLFAGSLVILIMVWGYNLNREGRAIL